MNIEIPSGYRPYFSSKKQRMTFGLITLLAAKAPPLLSALASTLLKFVNTLTIFWK